MALFRRSVPLILLALLFSSIASAAPLEKLAKQVESVVTPTLGQKLDAESAKALDELTDDPITLEKLAQQALDAKNVPLATFLITRSLEKEEIGLYERFNGSIYAKALIEEFLGNEAASTKYWNTAIQNDVLTAYVFLTRRSKSAQREELLKQANARVESIAAKARAGEAAAIMQTAKGPKNLDVLTSDEALERLKTGETLRYAFIEELDLRDQTFTEPVTCQRCVVGSVKGFNSTFERGFTFRGIVLKDLHLGKSWTGKVNRSRSIPAAKVSKLVLDKVLVLGDLNLNSLEVTLKSANFPFVVVNGKSDLRNTWFKHNADFRFASFKNELALKGARFQGPTYFGHLQAGGLDLTRVSADNPLLFDSAVFTGAVTLARVDLKRGATFENSRFEGTFDVHQSEVSRRLNLSRARFMGEANISYTELDDIDLFGARAEESFALRDSVVRGNARFALDGLNRRQHLKDVHPLHRLYKQYQGDVDADDELTKRSQYGVLHVSDLSAKFAGNSQFSNTIFEKFVGFEGVSFGSPNTESVANFYNTQFYGEAHFERTHFHGIADFRTISGNELSFNESTIEQAWLLDDANVPGRISMSGVRFADDANLSFYGARFAYFGLTMEQVAHHERRSRLFYEGCALGEVPLEDPRLLAASWNLETEEPRTDREAAQILGQRLCMDRAIGEFVVLRDSFNKRGMTSEADWAYWNLRHYNNLRQRQRADGALAVVRAWTEWTFFELGFGWGVKLQNLFWTSLVVILFFMVLIRLLCGSMVVDWDDQTLMLKELPKYALFVISLHSFLGRARDWKSKSSNKLWKVLYTTEMVIGILLITFFIGAYARIILR